MRGNPSLGGRGLNQNNIKSLQLITRAAPAARIKAPGGSRSGVTERKRRDVTVKAGMSYRRRSSFDGEVSLNRLTQRSTAVLLFTPDNSRILRLLEDALRRYRTYTPLTVNLNKFAAEKCSSPANPRHNIFIEYSKFSRGADDLAALPGSLCGCGKSPRLVSRTGPVRGCSRTPVAIMQGQVPTHLMKQCPITLAQRQPFTQPRSPRHRLPRRLLQFPRAP
ncbi:hypothetical protein J6590_016895 [Homalodisca vitripennis]|nr:hypothetical protein J6590_016895 [Homalodisca vitripennis]